MSKTKLYLPFVVWMSLLSYWAYSKGFYITKIPFYGIFDGGPEGNRTLDLCNANAALYQLSYRPMNVSRETFIICMVPPAGVEPGI